MKLPQMVVLASEYRQEGVSYASLAAKYKCSASTVRNKLYAWAEETGAGWPLKPYTQTRGQNRDTVTCEMVISEIHRATVFHRITQTKLAGLADMDANHLHKISSGHVKRIERRTQGKILEAISKLDAGEVEHTPQAVLLPMPIREVCPNGHRYTGRRDAKTGRKSCTICLAYKSARNDSGRKRRAS